MESVLLMKCDAYRKIQLGLGLSLQHSVSLQLFPKSNWLSVAPWKWSAASLKAFEVRATITVVKGPPPWFYPHWGICFPHCGFRHNDTPKPLHSQIGERNKIQIYRYWI